MILNEWYQASVGRVLAESAVALDAAGFDGETFGGQLEHIVESLGHFGPELQVAAGALTVFLLDLCVPVRVSRHLAWQCPYVW